MISLTKIFLIFPLASFFIASCTHKNTDPQPTASLPLEYNIDLRISGNNLADANAHLNIATYEYFIDLSPIGKLEYENTINFSLLGNSINSITLPIVRWPTNAKPLFKHNTKTYIGGIISLRNITVDNAKSTQYADTWLKLEVLANKQVIQSIYLKPGDLAPPAYFNPVLVAPVAIDASKF